MFTTYTSHIFASPHITHIYHTFCTYLTSSWLYDYTFFDICFYVVWSMSCLFFGVLRHPILLHFFDFVIIFFRLCTALCFFLSNKSYCYDHCANTIHHTIKSIKFDVVLFNSAFQCMCTHFHHLPPFCLRGDLVSVFYMNTVMLHFSLTHTHTQSNHELCICHVFSLIDDHHQHTEWMFTYCKYLQHHACGLHVRLSFEPSKHTWHCINFTYQTPDTM